MDVAGNVKESRKDKGLKVAELADAIGAHWATVYKIESRERKPSLDMLEKIALALDTTVAALVT